MKTNLAFYFILCFTILPLRADDELLNEQIKDCQNRPSMTWSSQLNRCINTTQSENYREASSACDSITDTKAKKDCQENLAREEAKKNAYLDQNAQKTSEDLKNKKTQSMLANATITGIALATQSYPTSKCLAKQIMSSTSLVALGTDLLIKNNVKKDMATLKSKFQSEASNGSFQSQYKALEFLRDEEAIVEKAASKEARRQTLLFMGYTAATVAAVMDRSNTACIGEEATVNKSPTSSTSSAGVDLDKIQSFLSSPTGVATISAVGAANALILKSAASEQADRSKSNKAKIEKMMETFKDSYKSQCIDGRDQLSQPACYCTLPDGSKNPNRSNSQTCITYFNESSGKILTAQTNYSTNSSEACITTSGAYDEQCQCKKFSNGKGGNICMKSTALSASSLLGSQFISASGTGLLQKSLSNLGSGVSVLDSSTGKLAALATNNLTNLKDQINKQIAANPELKNFKPLLDENKLKNAGTSLLNDKSMRALQSLGGLNAIAPNRPEGSLGKMIADTAKKNGLVDLNGNSDALKLKKKNETGSSFPLNFSDPNTGFNQSAQNAVEFSAPQPEKEFNYKNNDVNLNSDISLFEVISHRYMESGYTRLFE